MGIICANKPIATKYDTFKKANVNTFSVMLWGRLFKPVERFTGTTQVGKSWTKYTFSLVFKEKDETASNKFSHVMNVVSWDSEGEKAYLQFLKGDLIFCLGTLSTWKVPKKNKETNVVEVDEKGNPITIENFLVDLDMVFPKWVVPVVEVLNGQTEQISEDDISNFMKEEQKTEQTVEKETPVDFVM